jgi:hypothetical protein
MYIIRDKKDLAIAYWMVRDYQGKHKNEQMEKWLAVMDEEQRQKIEDKVKELKVEIRRYHREHPVSEEVLVHDDGIDGYIVRFPLPEFIKSREDGEEYFMENEYIRYRYTYYDCTGQAFTSWFKLYHRPDGRWWAYHRVSYDV